MPTVDESISAQGFTKIGSLSHTLDMGVWWNGVAMVELLVLRCGRVTLLRGAKSYFVTSRSRDGETWARDIGPAFDYLEHHHPELHITFRFWRDVPEFLAAREARRHARAHAGAPVSPAELANMQRHERSRWKTLNGLERLRSLDLGGSDLLQDHLRHREVVARNELKHTRESIDHAEATRAFQAGLQREYRDKGSAAAIVITINANIHAVSCSPHNDELRDAVTATVKELRDTDRYKVRQAFSGGRFKVGLSESDDPQLVWIEQWFGGSLSPNQLASLHELDPSAPVAMARQTMVHPNEDVVVDGSVVDHGKLVAPRVVASLLDRVDGRTASTVVTAPVAGPFVRFGLVVRGDEMTDEPFEVPLPQLDHVMFSGKTRSGKSFGQRVLLEEVALHSSVSVLVIDPRNQSAGVLAAQDRPEVLARFASFNIEEPRGFEFRYFAPANPATPSLPEPLDQLATGRHIVSLKGLDERDRCGMFADVLDAVFRVCSRSESASVRLVIAIDEAQLFTRALVAEAAKPSAERAETALNRVLREGRKFGMLVVLSSQSMRDFSRESVAIRQNIGTKVFFNNSDREIEYARDYMDDPRELVRLPPGTALFCNPTWGVAKVAVRPPLSRVWDMSERETAALLDGRATRPISQDAQRLLEGIRTHTTRTGNSPNASQAGEAAGLTSKRRLQELLRELTQAGCVRTTRLQVQGHPRVVELVEGVSSTGEFAGGHKSDTTGQEVRDGDDPRS